MKGARTYLAVTGVVLLLAIAGMFVRGFNFGVEFTGGRVVTFDTAQPVDVAEARRAVEDAGFPTAVVQEVEGDDISVRTRDLDDEEVETVRAALAEAGGETTISSNEVIGSTLGGELRNKAIIALFVALAAQLAYLAVRFRWTFAAGTVLAMLHDVIIVVGIFAWLGKPIDGVFLAAALTIIGVSVNDSVVTMDRIRETWSLNRTQAALAGRQPGDHLDRAAHHQHRSRRVLHPRRADLPGRPLADRLRARAAHRPVRRHVLLGVRRPRRWCCCWRSATARRRRCPSAPPGRRRPGARVRGPRRARRGWRARAARSSRSGARRTRWSDAGFSLVLLASCAVLLVAVLAVRLASRTGLPALLIYLGVGLAVGEAGLGVQFSDYELTSELGLVALALILAEGGLTTRWSVVRPALPFAVVLATRRRRGERLRRRRAVGAGARRRRPDRRHPRQHRRLDRCGGGLLGAAQAAAAPAAAGGAGGGVGAERRAGRRARRAGVLRRLGDDVGAATRCCSSSAELVGRRAARPGARPARARAAVPGGAAELRAVPAGDRRAGASWPSPRGPCCTSAASSPSTSRPSCWATARCRTAARSWASRPRPRCSPRRGCSCCSACSPRPPGCCRPSPEALLVGAAATLLARPLAVLVSRGALPAAVARAGVPVLGRAARGGPDRHRHHPGDRGAARRRAACVDVVFVLVVVYTLVQAPTLPWVGRRLGVVEDAQAVDVEVETAPLEDLRADLLQVRVGPGSRLHGVYVEELRLPVGAHVTLGRPRRAEPGARAAHAVPARRLAAGRGHQRRARRRRGAAAGGRPRRQAGPLARRGRRLSVGNARLRAGPVAPGMWSLRKPEMPTADSALPGRPTPIPVPERHEVLGTPMTGPWPEGSEVLYVAMGCFWGAERIFWQLPGVIATAAGYTGGFTDEPDVRGDLHRPHRPHRGRAGRLRPGPGRRRDAAEGVLGEPRPDAAQRAGQRPRHPVPHRRLPHDGRAARRSCAPRRRGTRQR